MLIAANLFARLIQHHLFRAEKQFHCTEPYLLSFLRTRGNFWRLQPSLFQSCGTVFHIYQVPPYHQDYFILTSFIFTHVLTGASGIWANTVMFSFLRNCHPPFRKTLPFLKKQSSGNFSRHIHRVVCWNEPWNFFVKKQHWDSL